MESSISHHSSVNVLADDVSEYPRDKPMTEDLEYLRKKQEEIEKYNFGKHLEVELDHEVKVMKKLLKELFSLVRVSESIAFDVLILKNPSAIKTFINDCTLNLTHRLSEDQGDFNMITDHISNINNLILDSMGYLMRLDKIRVAEISQESLIILSDKIEDVKQSLTHNNSVLRIDSIEEPQSEQNESQDKDLFTESFQTDLLAYIDSDSPLTEGNFMNRAILSSFCHRFRIVENLRMLVSRINSPPYNTQDLSYNMLPVESIYNSVVYKRLENNYRFLVSTHRSLLSSSSTILELASRIRQVEDNIKNGLKSAEIISQALFSIQETLKNEIHDIETKIKIIQNELEQSLQIVFPREGVSFNDSTLKNNTALFNQCIKSLQNNQSSIDPGNPDYDTISISVELAQQIYELRSMVIPEGEKCLRILRSLVYNQQALYATMSNIVSADEKASSFESMNNILNDLNQMMQDYIKNHSGDSYKKWMIEFDQSIESLIEVVQTQINLKTKVNQCFEANEDNEHFNDEYDVLCKEYDELLREEADIDLEIADEEEKLFEIIQNAISVRPKNLSIIEKQREHKKKEFEDMKFCPICKKLERDIVFVSCGHATCKQCYEKHREDKCPICEKSIGKDGKSLLFFQK